MGAPRDRSRSIEALSAEAGAGNIERLVRTDFRTRSEPLPHRGRRALSEECSRKLGCTRRHDIAAAGPQQTDNSGR